MYRKYKYHLYLLLVVIISYWPFVFFQSALLHDNIDVALSTKYFASECYNNGLLPLWNPYQLYGFPAHADLQYTNWNLETILISLSTGYNYIAMHLLFILYLYVSTLGMFLLSRHLSQSSKTALLISSVYVLSGIFSSHTQSLVTILGLVWLPFVIVNYLKWLKTPSFTTSILLIIFVYLFFTHGYQAFAFMIFPILMVLFVINLYSNYKQKQNEQLKSLLFQSVFIIVCLCLLFSPIIISQIQSQQFVNRLNGMSVNDVMENPFPVLGLLSLINPLITIGHDAWFNTEITMRNCYLGIVFLPIIFVSFFKKEKSTLSIVFLSFFVVYLFASFGDVLPVRKILYYIFPGFNLFRFPALIRVVSVLCLLCYISIHYQWIIDTIVKHKKIRNNTFLFLVITVISCIVLLVFKIDGRFETRFFNKIVNNVIVSTPIYELIIYTLLLQLGIVLILWKSLSNFKTRLIFEKRIGLAIILELMLMLTFYGQFTSFSELKPSDLQANFSKLQKGFPNPSTDALSENKFKFKEINHLWKNTGGLKKQLITDDPWTSFYFSSYDKLIQSNKDINSQLQEYSFIYGSKCLNFEHKIVLPFDTSLTFIKKTFHHNDVSIEYDFVHFQPTHFLIDVITNDSIMLNTLQSYYKGWEVYVDGIKADLYWNAGLLMSVKIPPGKHRVEFAYTNTAFTNAIIISYLLFIILIIVLIYISTLSIKVKHLLGCLFFVLVMSLCYTFYANQLKHQRITSNNFTLKNNPTNHYNFNNKADLLNSLTYLSTHSNSEVNYQWQNFYNGPEFWYMLGFDVKSMNNDLYKLNGDVTFKVNIRKAHQSRVEFISKELYHKTELLYKDTLQKALILGNKNPYTFPVNVTKYINLKNQLIGFSTIKADFKTKPVIACVIKMLDGDEKIIYYELNSYFISNSKWQSVPFMFELGNDIETIKQVNLFLMNQSGNDVLVKEVVL